VKVILANRAGPLKRSQPPGSRSGVNAKNTPRDEYQRRYEKHEKYSVIPPRENQWGVWDKVDKKAARDCEDPAHQEDDPSELQQHPGRKTNVRAMLHAKGLAAMGQAIPLHIQVTSNALAVDTVVFRDDRRGAQLILPPQAASVAR